MNTRRHEWNFKRDLCNSCGVTGLDLYDALFYMSHPKFNCPGVFSCCGGKSGGVKWSDKDAQWICKDCGSPSSNNSTVYIPRGTISYTPSIPEIKDSCECGAVKVFGKGTGHSPWCPDYKKV